MTLDGFIAYAVSTGCAARDDGRRVHRIGGRGSRPDGIAPALVALWLDARGDWDGAHRVAQDVPDPTVRGCMHTSTERKAMPATPLTGIEGRQARRPTVLSMKSGERLSAAFLSAR